MAAALSRLPSLDSVSEPVRLEGGMEVIRDPYFYLCGRFLALKKPIVIPSLTAALSRIWELKERILIREEEKGIFVFQFKDKKVMNRVLEGGPWYFNNSMLVLAAYDGISSVETVDLHRMDVWIAVKGLRIAMRNERLLPLLGNALGEFIEFDPAAMHRKDAIQRLRVTHDVRCRIWARREFSFSPELLVWLNFKYERCHGICLDCGFFGHDGGECDKGLLVKMGPVILDGGLRAAAVITGAVTGILGQAPPITRPTAASGEVPELAPEMEDGVLAGLSGGVGVVTGAGKVPTLSAPNPNLNSGLTAPGLTGAIGPPIGHVADGSGAGPMQISKGVDVALGPFGFRRNPKKRARYEVTPPVSQLAEALGLTEDDLESPLASLKKKGGGRILGSKNKVSRPSKKPGPQPPRVALNGDVAVKVSPNKGKGIA